MSNTYNETKAVVKEFIGGKQLLNYSSNEVSDKIRNAFIELNGNSVTISPKNFYRGSELFSLVEELAPQVIDKGIKDDHALMQFVDYRNIASGDKAEFIVKDNTQVIVATAADGISQVRRQRLADGKRVSIDTSVAIVRLYDDLSRFMSGNVEFDELMDVITNAMTNELRVRAIAALNGITASTAGLNADLVKSGSYDENALLKLCERVEAETGQRAKILGSLTALRKLTTATVSTEAANSMYNYGFYGKFNGIDMIRANQVLVPGTKDFLLKEDTVYVFGGDEKFIKVVNEGEGLLETISGATRADNSQEIIYAQNMGAGIVCGEAIGVYTMTN